MTVAPDEAAARRTEEILRELLEGKYDVPVVNVTTITQEEFRRKAPLLNHLPGRPPPRRDAGRQEPGLPARTGTYA